MPITWIISNRQTKVQTTFDLLREFHSEKLYQSRTIANQLVEAHPESTLDELRQKFPNETFHLFQIVLFYQRLQIAIKYRQVQVDLILELFGEVFTWWYIVCFDNQLLFPKSRFHAKKNIIDLYHWLVKNPKIA